MVGSEVQLLGPTDVRRLAAELDLRPTKQRGQNFVIDANTVRRIVRESGVGPDDVVVEVGPGLGSLTLALLEVAGPGRGDRGRRRCSRPGCRRPSPSGPATGPAAARSCTPTRCAWTALPGPPPTALVANLPYNVSVPVLLHLLTVLPSLEKGLVMVQAEVADRLAAAPGLADLRHPVGQGRVVRRRTPSRCGRAATSSGRRPTSTPGSSPGPGASRRPPRATREQVFVVVDAAFAQRRKTLRAALSGLAGSAAGRRGGAAGRGRRPGARGARCSTWRRTRGSRRPSPRRPRREHHGPGPGQDQPPPRRRGAARGRLPPAASPSTRRSGSATTSPRRPSPGWTLGVTVPDWIDPDAVPVTGDNIVDRAARLLADHHGVEPHASVSVAKSIPVAGGMAGGSADAAAALVALDRLWGLETSDDDLLSLAAELGSDVPFALVGGTALGTGRGELVEPVGRPGHVVVGGGPVARRGCPRPRSTGASTSSTPTPPPSPRTSGRCCWRWPPVTPSSSPARCTTTSSPRRWTCARTWPTSSSSGSGAGRCADWSRAPVPPASS